MRLQTLISRKHTIARLALDGGRRGGALDHKRSERGRPRLLFVVEAETLLVRVGRVLVRAVEGAAAVVEIGRKTGQRGGIPVVRGQRARRGHLGNSGASRRHQN